MLYYRRKEEKMFIEIARLFIVSAILVIVYFAYVKKDTLPKLVTLIILASIAAAMALSALAGLLSAIDFLENALKTLAGLIVYLEIGLLVFVMFFSKHKTKISLLKAAIIVYMVLVLLMALGVFR